MNQLRCLPEELTKAITFTLLCSWPGAVHCEISNRHFYLSTTACEMMVHEQQKKQQIIFYGFLLLCMGFSNAFKMQAPTAIFHSAVAFIIFLSRSLVFNMV